MPINSRQGLIDYALRRLGEPVITVDVAPEQCEDRVDDALSYYKEFHFDASEETFLKYQLTLDDITNRWIPVDDSVISITNVILTPSSAIVNMFDVRYQVMLNDFYNFNNTSMIHYQITRQHLALLEFMFNTQPSIRWNRKMNKLYIDLDWNIVKEGDFLIFQGLKVLDPTVYPKIYDDRWLKDYTTYLIQRQWGNNLAKFSGIQMLGGVTLNGPRMIAEAEARIEQLEKELRDTYEQPPGFILG